MIPKQTVKYLTLIDYVCKVPIVSFDSLKKGLAKQLVGVGEDRIAIRTQGCWSCVHASYEKAADLWWKKARGETLARGTQIALSSPQGEKDPRVMNIRKMVPGMDTGIEAKQWIACSVGKKPDGSQVADFVASTYLCDRWVGRDGSSIAREGAAPDKLPEEVFERHNEKKPGT